jgi:hypothetical protein
MLSSLIAQMLAAPGPRAQRGDRRALDGVGVTAYDQAVSSWDALVDEVANELATWPGVRVESRTDGSALVRYEHLALGVLFTQEGDAELPIIGPEREELIEHGDAEPADARPDSHGVSHDVHGPEDVTAVLGLFDRRYRDLRGEDDPVEADEEG